VEESELSSEYKYQKIYYTPILVKSPIQIQVNSGLQICICIYRDSSLVVQSPS